MLARKHTFIPSVVGAKSFIRANEWNNELDQLFNFLTGVLQNEVFIAADTIIPLTLKNNTDGSPVIEFKKQDVTVVRINENQQIVSLITNDAPIEVVNTGIVAGLNAEYLDGIKHDQFLAANRTVSFYVPFNSEFYGGIFQTFIVPAGTGMFITELAATSDTGGDAVDILLFKNGVQVTSITLNITNNFTNNIVINTGVIEDDLITVEHSVVDTPPSNICVRAKFKQTLVA